VSWDSYNTLTVAHYEMLTLAHNPETGLFQCAHCLQMIDAGNLGQCLNCYFNFADILAAKLFVDNGKILTDGILDIL